MPYYEYVMLVSARLGRVELADLMKRVSRDVFSEGGVITQYGHITSERGRGPRTLAYPITKNLEVYTEGYYVQFAAFMNPKSKNEVSRKIGIDKSVVRHSALSLPYSYALRPLPKGDEPLPALSVSASSTTYPLDKFYKDFLTENPAGSMFDAARMSKVDSYIRDQSQISALKAKDGSRPASSLDDLKSSEESEAFELRGLLQSLTKGPKPRSGPSSVMGKPSTRKPPSGDTGKA